MKGGQASFLPPQPENIQDEPQDVEEHYEPVPKNAPIPKEDPEGEGGDGGDGDGGDGGDE